MICLMTICSEVCLPSTISTENTRTLQQSRRQAISSNRRLCKYASKSNLYLRGSGIEPKNVVRVEVQEILELLLQPNSTTIKSAEERLNNLISRPRLASVLLDIILDFKAQKGIRQLAGTVLRRRIDVIWEHLNSDEQETMLESIADAILTESVPEIRRQLALSFGEMTKLSNSFAQLDRMVHRVAATCGAEDASCRELGLEVMQNLIEDLGDEMRSLYVTLVELCETALTDSAVCSLPSQRISAPT
jgi:hypothetical protein